MKISEMITDRYKLRIPPTVYYELLADVQELEEEQEPTTENDLGVVQDLVSTITEKISEQVTESHEEFIFETIRPYCENVLQIKISKRELKQALLKYYGKNDLGVDCVSRILVQSVISKSIEYKENPYQLYKRIERLPSVTPQEPRWIPVSEYLPVTNDEVLVTYIVNGNAKKRYVETANCFDGEWSSVNDEYRIPNTKIEIIAWMPLPKGYEEVEE